MRRSVLLALSAATMASACSPYLYKSEIANFQFGVTDLTTAYQSGLKNVSTERAALQKLQWTPPRATVSLTDGCALPALIVASTDDSVPCALQPKEKGMRISQAPRQAVSAMPILDALRDYASALATITNAEDQAALESAASQLQGSVSSLATASKVELPKELGALGSLVTTAGAATLNQRRFQMLKNGVTAANDSVAVLGKAMGEAFNQMRKARADTVLLTATTMANQLGPAQSDVDYAASLAALQAKVDTIETLRRVDPAVAANDMVIAHAELAKALNDDSRQIGAVVSALKTFKDKAEAVHDAFAS